MKIKKLLMITSAVLVAVIVVATSFIIGVVNKNDEKEVNEVKIETLSNEGQSDLISYVETVQPGVNENIVKKEIYSVDSAKIEKAAEDLNEIEKEAVDAFNNLVETGVYEDKLTGLVYKSTLTEDGLQVKVLTKDDQLLAELKIAASLDSDSKAIVDYVAESEEFKAFESQIKGYIEKLVFGVTREEHYSRNEDYGNLIENFEGMVDENGIVNKDYLAENGWDDSVDANCHQFTSADRSNVKYVSADGHYEFIFDKDGKVVLDDEDVGTYNFNDSRDGAFGAIKHARTDVITWILWGNTADDTTTPLKRTLSFFQIYI